MSSDKLTAMLARAASGDPDAAAAFLRTRAVRVQAAERFRTSGRAAAWRMIRAAE
ncbi:hypothetical protein OG369_43280 [Streptomyces sp. NBC_01221]|uniref:hypothetical protein n=1 Tax=Streptomyces sp. NBC_01221 TaxID=2903782 RepID=UPI0022585544|nr:hypothetical protein [Streptomyces sp. NBC_01221]MCX4792602.1 hypothetical protein [Streptomyces sp. NBC_01221]